MFGLPTRAPLESCRTNIKNLDQQNLRKVVKFVLSNSLQSCSSNYDTQSLYFNIKVKTLCIVITTARL